MAPAPAAAASAGLRGEDPMRMLETPRLSLEPQRAVHADAMFVVLGDPAIYAYENAPPASVARLRERYAALESRRPPDGRQQWLNWVLRLRTGELIGYVQASVNADGRAFIAYELGSAHWGRGLAREALEAMIAELATHYRVRMLAAVFKRANTRSRRLLERLGFEPAAEAAEAEDEDVMQCALAPEGTTR
jgi:ribosomal-protein-alanine N-acetyltransferase